MTTTKLTTKNTPAKKTQSVRKTPNQGVLTVLKKDHQEVKKIFSEYQKLVDQNGSTAQRQKAAQQICAMLTVHATAEEELFYSALRQADEDAKDLLDEAEVEHASANELIAQIQNMDPTDLLYDAKVKVLGEYVNHHVKEEETEIFPKAKKSGLDLMEMGIQFKKRKVELMGSEGVH